MRLIFVTQRVDPDDPILGATVAKITALAARVDEVVVLAESAVVGALPANCTVHSFEAGSRVGRGLRFEKVIAGELARRPRPDAVLAHMCPIYAVLAAPLARPVGTRVVLWYAHWNRSRMLEAAVRASNLVISVDARSVPVASPKVVGIGHGIDVSAFPCSDAPPSGTVSLTALGRYSAAKGIDTMIHAVKRARAAGTDARLRTYGTSSLPGEPENLERLRSLVPSSISHRGSRSVGRFLALRFRASLAESTALVNNMRAGAPDKVVYEACAACRPVIVSNPLFDELLDDLQPSLRFDVDDVGQLAARIMAVGALEVGERDRLGRTLRERVLARHSAGSWADAVVRLCGR